LLLLCFFHVSVLAQNADTCTALVESALLSLDKSCEETGRNEVCYGNTSLAAEFWDASENLVFSNPSDIIPAISVRNLSAAPLSVDERIWGLGLLRLQANIPGTIPGQNLTFLMMGNVEIENAVAPDEVRQPVEPLSATATTGVNLRSGPGTNFNVIGSVAAGETLQVVGHNPANDWMQVLTSSGEAVWISTQFITSDDDLSTLPEIGDVPLYGPMQAFYFQTGASGIRCAAVPPSHLLVSSPEGMEVTFTANDVNFTIGSIGALRAVANEFLTATTFDNAMVIESQGFNITVPEGFEIDVPLGGENGLSAIGAPQNFRPFDRDEWLAYDAISGDMNLVQAGGFIVPEEPPPPPPPGEARGEGGAPLGAGELQVTLQWDNLADMDLAVSEPGGTGIDYFNRRSVNGGTLDVDSNFPCGQNLNYVENIFWPPNAAPPGTYTVYVTQYSDCGAGNANWTLTVRADGRVIMTQTGSGGAATFTFTR
jgi:uncharacterized protein YgiM (DUF1202 family)